MSDSVLRQAQIHLEALRRAHGGQANPQLARSVARAAGLEEGAIEAIGSGRNPRGSMVPTARELRPEYEEEMGEYRREHDQFPGAGLALAEEAGGGMAAFLGGQAVQGELEREEQGEDAETPGEELNPVGGLAEEAGGGQLESLGEQLMEPPKELSQDGVPETQRGKGYPGEREHTQNKPVRRVTDESYGEMMKRLFHRQPITPMRDAAVREVAGYAFHAPRPEPPPQEHQDLSRTSPTGGNRMTHTPEVDIDGESGVEAIRNFTDAKWPRGRR